VEPVRTQTRLPTLTITAAKQLDRHPEITLKLRGLRATPTNAERVDGRLHQTAKPDHLGVQRIHLIPALRRLRTTPAADHLPRLGERGVDLRANLRADVTIVGPAGTVVLAIHRPFLPAQPLAIELLQQHVGVQHGGAFDRAD